MLDREGLHNIFVSPVTPALLVGAVIGGTGVIAGGFVGLLRSKHPAIFATATGIKCFGVGSAFWYFRGALTATAFDGEPTKSQRLAYSSLAAALSGAVNGALTSKRHIIPGAVVIGLIGCAGQSGYDAFYEQKNKRTVEDSRSLMERLSESKWMPLKTLSDQKYEQMLNDKLLRLEVEICMIDDKIASLRKANSSTAKRHT